MPRVLAGQGHVLADAEESDALHGHDRNAPLAVALHYVHLRDVVREREGVDEDHVPMVAQLIEAVNHTGAIWLHIDQLSAILRPGDTANDATCRNDAAPANLPQPDATARFAMVVSWGELGARSGAVLARPLSGALRAVAGDVLVKYVVKSAAGVYMATVDAECPHRAIEAWFDRLTPEAQERWEDLVMLKLIEPPVAAPAPPARPPAGPYRLSALLPGPRVTVALRNAMSDACAAEGIPVTEGIRRAVTEWVALSEK